MEKATKESQAESRFGCATGFEDEIQEVTTRIEKGVNDMKAAVSAKLEDGKFAAERLLKRGRYAVEDGIDEAAHTIKHHPIGSLAVAFAAGAAVGLLVPRLGRK